MMTSGVLIYDADCGFCTQAAKWLSKDESAVRITPWQAIDLNEYGLTVEEVTTRAYWSDEKGLRGGSDAIGAALVVRGGASKILGWITLNPLVRPVARPVYGWIARNRQKMPGATDSCALPKR